MKLLKNGTVLTAEAEYRGDILIDGETIRAVGTGLDRLADEVIDAAGKYIFPGGVDEHTHFGSFGGRLFETTVAAAVGGTTTIVDFAPQERGDSLGAAVEKHAARALGVSCVDFGFHSMVMDMGPDTVGQLEVLRRHGVSCVKMFMAYKGTPFYMEDDSILNVMAESRRHGITMMVHAEDPDMISFYTERLKAGGHLEPVNHSYARPPITEEEAVRHAIAMARVADVPLFIVHVSTKGGMEAVRDAYAGGQSVYGETCTHYLVLDTSFLEKPDFEGAKYVCAPPLRPREHLEALWEGIGRGWLNAVSSDHCALVGGFEKKKEGLFDFTKIPNGVPGVQSRVSMLWSQGVAKGRITKQRFVDLIATAPAKNSGLVGKGQIAPGFDADLVVYDPDYRGAFTQKGNLEGVGYHAFEGFEMVGRPELVFLRGEVVAEKGRFTGRRGGGRRLFARPYAAAYGHFKPRVMQCPYLYHRKVLL